MLACVAFCTAQAQRFEWAKGYDSSYDDAYIKGSVTDSHGNLYILGQFHYDSDWDNEPLCGQLTTTNTMVIVAKISPEGEMVWKKVFGNTANGTYANDIKALGDTGFAVMIQGTPCNPYYSGDYIYWVDSLYHNIAHPLLLNIPDTALGYSFYPGGFTVYMSFDFNGNINEQHLLQISYVDTDGNSVITSTDSLHWILHPINPTFDVDAEGNIYVCREANDYAPVFALYNGMLGAVRYWVDHRLVGESPIENGPKDWFPQLLRFSPHFDTLQASKYVVQDCDRSADSINHINGWRYIIINKTTNKLYHSFFLQTMATLEERITIDSLSNTFVVLPEGYPFKSFITVHNLDLSLCYLINLRDSALVSGNHYSTSSFTNIGFDSDSGLVFVSADIGSNNTQIFYNNTPLNIDYNSCVLVFNENDFRLHSVLKFPCIKPVGEKHVMRGNLAVGKNRVFKQSKYQDGVMFPSGNYYIPSSNMGMALTIWDYKGNILNGIDYNTNSKYNDPGAISLFDSTLFLTNLLASNATFGEHTVYASPYRATVAKYVDTSFMSVYRQPSPEAIDVAEQSDIVYYPNPVNDILHVALDGDIVLRASAISILGQCLPVDVKGNDIDVTNLPPGFYTLRISTFGNKIYNLNIIKQ